MTVTYNSESYFQAIEERRSYYALSASSPLSPSALRALVERAVEASPTSFNMQHLRAVVVTGRHHRQLWTVLLEQKLAEVPEDRQEQIRGRFAGHLAAYGSVLVFEDTDVLRGYAEKMPAFGDAFKVFSAHASGMLHHVIWTALEKEGLGANLQHNAEGSEPAQAIIRKITGVPDSWVNSALVVFGTPAAPPAPKAVVPGKERVRVLFDEDEEAQA